MKKIIYVAVILSLVSFGVFAKGKKENLIPNGSRVFITPMDGGMEQFIAAEIVQQKVPVSVVLNENAADYVITGTAVKKDGSNKWYHYATGTQGTTDSVQSSISLIEKKDKVLVWADNAGDRSFFWGALKRGGERKVALRLVKKFKIGVFPSK